MSSKIREVHIFSLTDFIRESNRIEGYKHEPTSDEIAGYVHLESLTKLTVPDIELFVDLQTRASDGRFGAVLRRAWGCDVRVGGHVPPPGGPGIEIELGKLLGDINYGLNSYEAHLRYETLHPFTDGNGRSGRAIWWWQHGCEAPLGFLHEFYYETLRRNQY